MAFELSVVVITHNEEENLGRCLQSVLGVADEIIVVDSLSTDRTRAIARAYGARVVQNVFEGYGQQKNLGNDLALYDYILSLDADEAICPDLVVAIKKAKADEAPPKAYRFNRLTYYYGVPVWHCGWYPDVKVRLWHKAYGAWNTAKVHEALVLKVPDEAVGYLRGNIRHDSYKDPQSREQQIAKYSSLGAAMLFEQGRQVGVLRPYTSAAFKFLRTFFLQRGFLDGRVGWRVCESSARETFMKYQKLRALQLTDGKA